MATDAATTGDAHDWHRHVPEFRDVVEQASKQRALYEVERTRRASNLNAQQPTEEELMLCDSSFKKNNGLIRKLKSITLREKDALVAEIQRVNQTKYVSEVVSAIAESVIKGKDMPAAIEICSLLHQRYPDFAAGIKEALTKGYLSKTPGEEVKSMVARRRSALRLLMELYLAGLFDGLHLLLKVVRELVNLDYEKDSEMCLHNVMLLTSFAKIGRCQILLLPEQPTLTHFNFQQPPPEAPEEVLQAWQEAKEAHEQFQAESAQRFHVSENEASEFIQHFTSAADRMCETVLAEHKKLRDLENENTRVLNAKGELPETLAADYELKRKGFDHLHGAVTSLAECLDKPMPELPEDKVARIQGGVVQIVDVSDESQAHPLFDDAETREFYEALPDLRSVIPPLVLGLAEDKEDTPTASDTPDPETPVKESDTTDSKTKSATSHKKMDALIQKLKNCYTRDMADEISMDFCYINSKSTRKRLTRALCDVPKGCLPLIPFFSRIAANLNQIFPDITNGIVAHLEQEFSALLAKKDPGTFSLEPRITNMRYMGEMCKFKLMSYGTVFTCLKQLLDDFTHMNIDAACALIETAGSFLVRLPETQGRMENRLEQMNRLKNAKNLDSRHRALIDSAYFQCKPPKSGVRRKTRPPIHEYIRHLVFTVLSVDTFTDVLTKLRKLTWAEHEAFVVHCMLKASVKLYAHVPLVASLCSGLAKYNDSLAVSVVDSVFEEIQLGMEHPGVGLYQHRIAHVRFFGELYNYRLIDSRTVFDTLYWILSFGRWTPEEMQRLDPPGDAFRIKMVCTVLETCGRYFGKGTAPRRKMDRFLTYFQRYILSKPTLSMDIEFEISDVFEHLRPDLNRYGTFEEANAAVEVIEAEQAAKEEAGKSVSEGEDEESQEGTIETEESIEEVGLDEDDVVDHGRKPATPEIDLEFEQGLQALLQEHQRLTPDQIKPVEDLSGHEGMVERMQFKVMLKRGGKDDTSRRLEVPLSVPLAVRQKEHDNQEAVDRSIIKERVLAAHEKDEEEEFYSGSYGRYPRGGRGRHGGHASYSYGGRRYRRH